MNACKERKRTGVGSRKHRLLLPVLWISTAIIEGFTLRLCGNNRKKWSVSIYLSIYIYKTLLICIPNIYIKILKTTVLNCKIHKALVCQKFFLFLNYGKCIWRVLCLCHRKVNCCNLQDVVVHLAQESFINRATLKYDKCSDAKEVRRKFRRCSQVEQQPEQLWQLQWTNRTDVWEDL